MNTEQTPKSPRLSNRELAHRIRSGTSTPAVLSALYEAVARLIEDKPEEDADEVIVAIGKTDWNIQKEGLPVID